MLCSAVKYSKSYVNGLGTLILLYGGENEQASIVLEFVDFTFHSDICESHVQLGFAMLHNQSI